MKTSYLLLFVVFLSTAVMNPLLAAEKIKVLIVDGPQKFHEYEKTTPVLKEILEQAAIFEVALSRSTPEASKDGSYMPDFSKYDVVVINEGFDANDWPEATQKAFEKYVSKGGGMVSYHAANNAWPKWAEYNKMTAVGGWGGRNEKSGPYLYMNEDGKVVRDDSPGSGGSHGPQHVYEIKVREPEHPIMKGLPAVFNHGPDELYDRLRGPAENVTILASAFSSKDQKGTGHQEPIFMVIDYGKGRVFHTVLGHAVKHLREQSFITTFQRGTEWAATGKVTIPVPEGFPNRKE
jgi:type 1 glutamine amidotransferase